MASRARILEFAGGEPGEMLATMDRLRTTGAGWVNIEPEVDPELVPAASGMFGIFSARGPVVPLGTWTPPTTARRGRGEPEMIGLQHPAGTRARQFLADAGHPVPPGWAVTQDHSRKGLVVVVAAGATTGEVLGWLVTAMERVSVVPVEGRWRATIYGEAP